MLDAPTLQNVSFTVRHEQLLAVIGPVGAGKVSYFHYCQIYSHAHT